MADLASLSRVNQLDMGRVTEDKRSLLKVGKPLLLNNKCPSDNCYGGVLSDKQGDTPEPTHSNC